MSFQQPFHSRTNSSRMNKTFKCSACCRYRGSYMSVRVLLNLFKELRKRDKKRGLLSNLFLFRNEFNGFNYTGALIYDIKIIFKSYFWRETFRVLPYRPDVKSVIEKRFPKICKLLAVYRIKCMALFHSQIVINYTILYLL